MNEAQLKSVVSNPLTDYFYVSNFTALFSLITAITQSACQTIPEQTVPSTPTASISTPPSTSIVPITFTPSVPITIPSTIPSTVAVQSTSPGSLAGN